MTVAPQKTLFDKLKMPVFLKILAAFYALGFLLHFLDVLDLRLTYSTMSDVWKAWTVYLLVFDLITAGLLIYRPKWGAVLFHIVALSQLVAYFGFQEVFGRQDALIIFHVISLVFYWKIVARIKRSEFERAAEAAQS